jgi:phosphate transport system permease protein
MRGRRRKWRVAKDNAFRGMVVLFSLASMVPLVLILFYILKNGISALGWDFLAELPKPVGEKGGGIANGLVGSMLLVITAGLPAIPLGVAAGVYLSEHKGTRLSYWAGLAVDVLQGIPSIVIGIIAYVWVVVPMRGFSALSGGVALGIMMLPMIIKSTEETLTLIPYALKEAALALGVPYYRTVLRVVLPAGLSGIMTGVLISVARIAGETAPLIFTAFGNAFMNWNIMKPVNSLPLLIYNYATSPYPEWHRAAWGASCVLIGFILTLNLAVRVATRRWKVQF